MKTPKPIRERRDAARISEKLPFKIGNRSYAIEAVTQNISTTGALCLVDKEIPLMTQLDVSVSLSGTQKVRMKGVVVRKDKDVQTGKFFLGIFFSELQPIARNKLKKFIDRRLKPD